MTVIYLFSDLLSLSRVAQRSPGVRRTLSSRRVIDVASNGGTPSSANMSEPAIAFIENPITRFTITVKDWRGACPIS
jgi:hypothetical protein